MGIEQGWNQIYNQSALRELIARHFTGDLAVIDGGHTFPNPPLLAWLVAPLTLLPFGPAYAIWSLLGLASVIVAWAIAAPFVGLARIALLLTAVAIWPVHYSLILGQPTPEIIALAAAAWWLLERDRVVLAGVALAVATSLKPQDVVLVPVALLLTGRWRVFAWWAGSCVVLGLIFLASLGVQGVADFWNTNVVVESYPGHQIMTLASVFGPGLPAYVLEGGSAVVALYGAWRHRARLKMVIALGLLGSVMAAVHAHESDYCMALLAAWLVLATPTSPLTRLWLLPGVLAVQTMSIGWPLPTLLWEIVWLVLLVAERPLREAEDRNAEGQVRPSNESRLEPENAGQGAIQRSRAGEVEI
ncbi:MAG TPA: glycosyltransferase family 87 protein [Candidatus Dormibacteraeota bacterium]|nr:glycosyltransferase family 87 protein [Candidatus Dormibacteraeota bacterium]